MRSHCVVYGTGGGEEVVKEHKCENKFGHVQLTPEESSLGMVSCGIWLYPHG